MPFLTYNALALLVESAVTTQSLTAGRAAHAHILKTVTSPTPIFLSNHLVNMYSKLDLPNWAQHVLHLTPRTHRSVVTWTALIAGSVLNGRFSDAVRHMSGMLRDSVFPNDFTFPCVFKACGSLRSHLTGRQIHALAVKAGLIGDAFVGCSAFDMYSKTGLTVDANNLFDEMPERNLATWNAYMSNSVLNRRPTKAIEAFVELRRIGGEPDSITFCAFLNACSDGLFLPLGKQLHGFVIRTGYSANVSVANGMIDFYGKCRDVASSMLVFDGISNCNIVSWSSMVAAYEQNDEGEKACVTFMHAMRETIEPTDFIVSSVISACASLAVIELGRSVHALSVKCCVDGNVVVGSALVDMYAKCGNIKDCENAFDEMPERNIITWNGLISGYAHQGHADRALALFEEMSRVGAEAAPNYITLVCVLSACSRDGKVKDGMEIFESMRVKYKIEPGREHYACIVDLLGRAGMVGKAYEFIRKMPIPPTVSIWGALLGACQMHGYQELGKIAAENLFRIDPTDSGNHVILSNMFAAAGRWEEANTVRAEMKDVGITKGTGYSWISVKNKLHVFQAKDTSHEQNSEIQAMLAKLKMEMNVQVM